VSTQYADIGELVRQLCEQHVHPEDIITKAEPLLDEDGERIFGEPMTLYKKRPITTQGAGTRTSALFWFCVRGGGIPRTPTEKRKAR
jgi:hypothetical protein